MTVRLDSGYSAPSGFLPDAKERLGMTPGVAGQAERHTISDGFDSPIGRMLSPRPKRTLPPDFDDSEDR